MISLIRASVYLPPVGHSLTCVVQPGDIYTALTAAIAIEHSLYRFFGKDEECVRYNSKARCVLLAARFPAPFFMHKFVFSTRKL